MPIVVDVETGGRGRGGVVVGKLLMYIRLPIQAGPVLKPHANLREHSLLDTA
jgi:hypothetical protein